MAKAKKKEQGVKVEEHLRRFNKVLILLEEEGRKFDARDRGWKPGGTRLRKTLYALVNAIQTLRKEIQNIKNEEG